MAGILMINKISNKCVKTGKTLHEK